MITRQSWRRHRPTLQALPTQPAKPEPVPPALEAWMAGLGVAKPTMHISEIERALLLHSELITRGQLLRGDQ